MNQVIAHSIDGKTQLITNGNHIYWIKPKVGNPRELHSVRSRESAVRVFEMRTACRLTGQH